MSKKSLRIQVKKAKNEMIIITAPDGEDYPCREDEEIASAIKEIVDDEEQYKVVQSEPIRAEVEVEHRGIDRISATGDYIQVFNDTAVCR